MDRRHQELRAVTFDVTGTLLHCPRLAQIYAEVLQRHGIDATAGEVETWFPVVWEEMSCRTELGRDRFSTHPEGARGWWRDLLDRLCAYLREDRFLQDRPDTLPEPTRFTAAELYHRFSRPEAWEVYPDVRPTLAALQASGLALGVVSNWDERLGPLLSRLDLIQYFDALIVSSRVGVEKPDPRIFHHALELLEVPPEAATHVGDRLAEDVEGALGAGMSAFHLVREEGHLQLEDLPGGAQGLERLEALPERLEAPGA